MVTLTATGDCLGLTRAGATLQELEVCRLVGRLATTDIQSAAQPQAEDAGVTGETESAEKWSSGLLMSRRISFEHHRSLRRHGSRREQRHDDGGAYQEQRARPSHFLTTAGVDRGSRITSASARRSGE